MASSNPLVVGAIDFGTTFSGWAYSFMHEYSKDPTKATVKHWYSGTGSIITEKTPTCALIKPDGKTLEAFGYDAENKYTSLAENDEHAEYYYFRRFKMALNSKTISRELLIEDEMGKKLPAVTVFGLSIEALTNDMLMSGKKQVAGGITMKDVHWVLTVPAIWSDGAKQFMREAAVTAGIETEKLSIALEPEAASIFCRHLPVEKSYDDSISNFPVGVKYMVLDAGGGTIDITVHQITQSGGLKEVHSASGGGWGGILVDNAFKDLLIELFGQKVYDIFVDKYTDDWLDLWRTFESKKKTINPENTAPTNMKFSVALLQLYRKETGHEFEDIIDSSKYSSKIKLRGGDKVRFDHTLMKKLFSDSITATVAHITSILRKEKSSDIKAILMVGGFSESPMLQEAVKKNFRHLKVIIPREASSSILRGAVIFGHNPKSIFQRVLKKTYGVAINEEFQEGIHPERLKHFIDNQEFCDNIFSKHVEIDQAVNVGEPQIEKTYIPTSEDQQQIPFHVFASDLKDPLYTDQGCEYLGELSVDISNLPEDLERQRKDVLVSLTFSGTEIIATARVKETGEKTSATFDFLQ